MSPTGGGVHRCPQILVHGIHVDVLLQQELNHPDIAIGGGYVKLKISTKILIVYRENNIDKEQR